MHSDDEPGATMTIDIICTGILVICALIFAWQGDVWEEDSSNPTNALWSSGALAAAAMSLGSSRAFIASPLVALFDHIVPNWAAWLHELVVLLLAGTFLCVYIFLIFTVPSVIRFYLQHRRP